MVDIPGGEIVLRDNRICQKWSVETESFLLASYPVKQDIYFKITGESPCKELQMRTPRFIQD
jgi:hypothetical protein